MPDPSEIASPPAFKHYSKAQSTFKPPCISSNNAFLGDVFSRHALPPPQPSSSPFPPADSGHDSQHLDATAPISCGFYRLEKGDPLVYTYTYHEMKIIVEGSYDIEDETGQKVHAVPGDVFFFPKGAKITFTTDDYGLAFYTGQRAEGAA